MGLELDVQRTINAGKVLEMAIPTGKMAAFWG